MVKIDLNEPGNIILFKRMNQRIIDTYKLLLGNDLPDMQQHKELFEQTYSVRIHYENWGSWTHMEFSSEEAYTLALLKWM